ncbi:MAG: ABC transporter ATP-binding protein [Terracidiphilus sp.]
MLSHSTTSSSEPESAITIENVGKKYSIGRQRANGDGLRHAIEGALRQPLGWFRSRREAKLKQVDFWALRDVSLQIKRGEVVGIIGSNGAGKSTLLKLLSRITLPTEGRICIGGRVASLLEVGTGFHPELTGRENIFLNGAILGMPRAEIIRKFDEIVAFSEIDEFIDTPVKRYSSGMYIRLAFAVAAHLEPEILIVDEVLAVGDTAFQKKCLGKMGSFAQSGKTILLVSHNLEAVRNLCPRSIWLKGGRIQRDGKTEDVLEGYYESISRATSFSCENPDYGLTIHKVVIRNADGKETTQFFPGEDLVVDVFYEAKQRIEKPIVALGVLGVNGSCFTSNMLLDGNRPDYFQGVGKISCTFKSIPLLPQGYTIKLIIRASSVVDTIIPYEEVGFFNVVGDLAAYGFTGEYLKYASRSTPVVVPYEWSLPDGRIVSVALSRTQTPSTL